MPTPKRVLSTIAIIIALYLVNAFMSKEGLFGFGFGAYPTDVLMTLTINIILAVSLNLITGFTGQFSIGHAGFMAIGAYSSAYLVVYHAQFWAVSYTHLRAHETPEHLVCRLLLE